VAKLDVFPNNTFVSVTVSNRTYLESDYRMCICNHLPMYRVGYGSPYDILHIFITYEWNALYLYRTLAFVNL